MSSLKGHADAKQVNILAFLSSTIFNDAILAGQHNSSGENSSASIADTSQAHVGAQKKALWMSFGFGLANFVFTCFALGRIDSKVRLSVHQVGIG